MSGPANVACVVLAAGSSRRFGGTKMLASIGSDSLLRRVLREVQSSAAGRVHVVTGHDAERVAAQAADFCDETVFNPRHAQGMGTSIAAGVSSLPPGSDAVLIVLGDQPLMTAGHFDELIAAWSGHRDAICASQYENTAGAPAVFPRAAFPTLAALEGDRGAKVLLAGDEFEVMLIPCEELARDVNTPDDLAALD